MIDHLIRFNSEVEAKADPVVGAYWSEDGGWRGDCCFAGQRVWRPQDDTVETDPESGAEYPVSHPLPYWYITICMDAVDDELSGHHGCMLVWDADADQPISSALPLEQLSEYALSPVPAGRTYGMMGLAVA